MWKKVKIAAAKNVLGELVISQDNETLIFVEDDADAAAQLELLEKKKMQRAKWRSAIGKIGQMQSSVAAWQTKLEDDAQVNRAVSAVMINMALKVMADTATTACVSPHCRPEPACLPPRRSLSAARDQLQQPARRPNTRAAACCVHACRLNAQRVADRSAGRVRRQRRRSDHCRCDHVEPVRWGNASFCDAILYYK
jgi:hypothetical protein